jgi:hypothetical protein
VAVGTRTITTNGGIVPDSPKFFGGIAVPALFPPSNQPYKRRIIVKSQSILTIGTIENGSYQTAAVMGKGALVR